MPGRFREGTETCIRKVRTLETLPTCRQTQNPERGRKREEPSHLGLPPAGRQTQNPERGRKHFERELVHSPPFRSSDPKPREGTETRKRSTSLTILFSRRQTQNPERGRKLDNTFFERGAVESVVRPKTPRGDGNAPWMADALCAQVSSDPKPREGTETPTMASKSAWVTDPGRQTQNPERGRKR
ncbi:Uncharacterised protein [Mycobacterium tuberculosis]|nr:Uncharacterised protein [Mycobacterium tuberculosis]